MADKKKKSLADQLKEGAAKKDAPEAKSLADKLRDKVETESTGAASLADRLMQSGTESEAVPEDEKPQSLADTLRETLEAGIDALTEDSEKPASKVEKMGRQSAQKKSLADKIREKKDTSE